MFVTRPRTAGPGTVSIHSSEPLGEILQDAVSSSSCKGTVTKAPRRKTDRSKSAGRFPSHSLAEVKRISQNADHIAFDMRSWLSEKTARSIQEKTEYESSSVRNLYNTLLENESDLVEGVQDYLAQNEELQRRKKILLLRDWNDNVYSPLKTGIEKEMGGQNYQKLDREKRELYNEYLNYSNKKGNVFLDTMSYEEYDPLSMNGHRPGPLKVVMKKSKDPLLLQEAKRIEEERIIIACDTGLKLTDREIENFRLPPLPLVPVGRHGTKFDHFLAMELNDIQSDARQRSQRRMLGIRTKSAVDFEAWQNTQVDGNLIDGELRSQKRRQFQERHHSTILLT